MKAGKVRETLNTELVKYTDININKINIMCSLSFTAWLVRRVLNDSAITDDDRMLFLELWNTGKTKFTYLKGIDFLLLNCPEVFDERIKYYRDRWIERSSHVHRFKKGLRSGN